MRTPLTIVVALSGFAAAGLLRPSFLARSDRSINLFYHPIVSGSVSGYSLYVRPTPTRTVSPSRDHIQAAFSIQRRNLDGTAASPIITNIVMPINNLIMASEFNLFFSVMSPNSTCDRKINTQAIVCINDQIATCGNDGKYKLQACPLGRKCRAVPLDPGQTGLSIQCVPNDGANMVAQFTSRSATPTSTPIASASASASLINNNRTASPGQESVPIKIETTTKTAIASLSGNKKLNEITQTSLHTSAAIKSLVFVNSSHALSTATHLFATRIVPTPTRISSAEISSKSETAILRIIPVPLVIGE